MRINTNISAMNTYSRLTAANTAKSGSLAKLSSGLRINKAGDDAAGLAISEKMKNQVSGMTQASRNAQDGISLIQTAEGALKETHSILNRMRDLTVQAGNATNTDDDKGAIQAEINSLTEEINRIAGDTEFNTKGLLNGGSVTAESIANADASTVEKAFNAKFGQAVGGTDTKAATLAADVAKLNENNLESLVKDYNNKNNIKVTDFTEKGVTQQQITDSGAKLKDLASVYNAKFGQAAGGTDTAADGSALHTAMSGLDGEELETLVNEYNKTNDISVSDIKELKSTNFSFQIGANAGEQISVEIRNMSAKGLGLAGIDVTGDTDAILGKLDKAISQVSDQRANLGAVQNRLDHTVSNLATTKENLSEANSRITDVDMAEEMMSFTKSNILSQAATSMLAQANQMPQGVLQLLQ